MSGIIALQLRCAMCPSKLMLATSSSEGELLKEFKARGWKQLRYDKWVCSSCAGINTLTPQPIEEKAHEV
jgi:hypothetical protein